MADIFDKGQGAQAPNASSPTGATVAVPVDGARVGYRSRTVMVWLEAKCFAALARARVNMHCCLLWDDSGSLQKTRLLVTTADALTFTT